MLSQNERDSYNAADHTDSSNIFGQASQYRVIVQRQLLDEYPNLLDYVIDFAFETLGAHHLQLRVCQHTAAVETARLVSTLSTQ